MILVSLSFICTHFRDHIDYIFEKIKGAVTAGAGGSWVNALKAISRPRLRQHTAS